MDNIGDILKNLSDEDIENLKTMASSLFSSSPETKENRQEESDNSQNPFSNINPDVILKVSSLMGNLNQHDSRCDLIEALKPNLSKSRQKRADEAMQLIRLLDILPIIENLK